MVVVGSWCLQFWASCSSASMVSVSVGGRKNTTDASCNGWNHYMCKWNICAGGWGRNTTTVSCCLLPTTQAQGAKVRTSISASWSRMQQLHATPTTATTNQLRISMDAIGVHNATIIATCLKAQWSLHCESAGGVHDAAIIAALCTPPPPVLILSWLVVVYNINISLWWQHAKSQNEVC